LAAYQLFSQHGVLSHVLVAFVHLQMKCAMCRALDARLRCLLAAGRHVLLVGDLNCLAWPQDCAAFAVAPHDKQVWCVRHFAAVVM
jgi:exonuclease III